MALAAIRRSYRVLQPAAAAAGLPMRPWIRGSVDIGRWLRDAQVQHTMRDALLSADSKILAYVDRQAIDDTLRLGAAGSVANEVPLNLYRIERVLRHFPAWHAPV